MRYIIIGAGAIGSALGGRLTQVASAHPAVLVARGQNLRALQDGGVHLSTPDEDVTIGVDVVAGASELRLELDDVLVFSTKTQQLSDALLEWADAPVFHGVEAGGPAAVGSAAVGTAALGPAPVGSAGELLPVIMLMNGMECDRLAARYFERVFSACLWLPAVSLRPGEVILPLSPVSGMVLLNRYAVSSTSRDQALMGVIARDWAAASFTTMVVANIRSWKFNKLLSNLGNAVQALVGVDEPLAEQIVGLVRSEAERVLAAAGIEWVGVGEEQELRGDLFDRRAVPGAPSSLGGSSWQSLQRGRGDVETDYLNGEIVLIAHLNGLAAPVNAEVQQLSRRAARSGALPGSTDAAGLLETLTALAGLL